MRVLQIGADRSKRGILYPGSSAFKRQEAYAKQLGNLDIIGFSLMGDGAHPVEEEGLSVYPTNSFSRLLYAVDAVRIARGLPVPDVVSVQDPFETGLVGWLISWMKKVPLHVQVHTDFLSPEYARVSLMNRLRVLIAGFVLRRAARVRVVSERVKQSIEARYQLSVPVTVLPIFADVQRFKTATVDAAVTARFARFKTKFLVVARLEREKNVALALRAFAQSARHDSCLIIAGEGREAGKLARLVQDLGITGRVFFESNIADIAPWYALADIVLVPSRYEGYGLVTVEALAAGKPVLSTDVGIAGEAGAIIAPPGHFARALRAWFENGPRTGELKEHPYKNFDEYVRAYCDDIRAVV